MVSEKKSVSLSEESINIINAYKQSDMRIKNFSHALDCIVREFGERHVPNKHAKGK